MTKGLKMKDKWAEKNNVCPPWVETKKKMLLVVCKVRINLPLFSTVVPAVVFFCSVGLSLL